MSAAAGALGICLTLAASMGTGAGDAPVFIGARDFTLAWTHSIEKVRWEEDYRVEAAPEQESQVLLRATTARVRGSAAGMEPPPGARMKNGWYEYTPATGVLHELRLTRSEFTADYDLCVDGQCRTLKHWLPSDGGITLLVPCHQPAR